MDTTREDVRLLSAKKWNFLRSTSENKLTLSVCLICYRKYSDIKRKLQNTQPSQTLLLLEPTQSSSKQTFYTTDSTLESELY